MGKTSIEWTDFSWTPLRARVRADAAEIAEAKGYTSLVQIAKRMTGKVGPHCERVSRECDNCYSETNNGRCLPDNGTGLPFDRRSRDLIEPIIDEKILLAPSKWGLSRKVFVCSQTDLFGEWVSNDMIDRVWRVMLDEPRHLYQVLTKRAERMLDYLTIEETEGSRAHYGSRPPEWIWLGVSCGTRDALPRIDELRETPAAVRFLSIEPLLEDLGTLDLRGIGWVIVGSESGRGARPMRLGWVRSVRDQCRAAGVPFFMKQITYRGNKCDFDAFPDDLRVREFPKVGSGR